MTDNLPGRTQALLPGVLATAAPVRRSWIDVFRGLLIAHMGLDHASLMFNAGRGAEELASAAAAPAAGDLFQFLTRFTGIPVAPGFFFMAGFMVALTSLLREERGVAQGEITRRLIIRGLVLIAVDALIMGVPRAAMGFYSFMVLSSIGVSLILVALMRHLPTRVLIGLALAILLLHPLQDVSELPLALRAILYEPVRTGAFRSLYPVLPWLGIVIVGFVIGRDAFYRERPARMWLMLAGISFAAFFVVRGLGGYGNAYPYTSVSSFEFWSFAKYPPDLPFLAWAFGWIFVALALLSTFVRNRVPLLLRPFEAFGRVPFFFYIVHFYVLGVAQALLQVKYGLAETYGIWLSLLAVMIGPCVWYGRIKQKHANFFTRYV